MQIKQTFKTAFTDRGFLIAWLVGAVIFLAILIMCAVEIRPSDLQVPIRYSAFGITNIYRAQWYSELAMVGFAVLMMVIHTFLGVRLYSLKDRRYAIAFQWLTVVLLAITFLILLAIFRVISIVE